MIYLFFVADVAKARELMLRKINHLELTMVTQVRYLSETTLLISKKYESVAHVHIIVQLKSWQLAILPHSEHCEFNLRIRHVKCIGSFVSCILYAWDRLKIKYVKEVVLGISTGFNRSYSNKLYLLVVNNSWVVSLRVNPVFDPDRMFC